MWSPDFRERAINLRKKGFSFSEIVKQIGVPKSTLSGWLSEVEHPNHLYFTNRKEWLGQIRILGVAKIKQNRLDKVEKIVKKTKEEVESWDFIKNKSAQKAILSFLYWAEGSKLPVNSAPVKFANTDPRLILLFVTILRNCYPIDPNRIKIKLYLHWYHDQRAVKAYWSKLLEIPEGQFGKIYLKHRSKTKRFRKNFMGICFVTYQSVYLRHEIIQTAYALQTKIVVANNAPVA